MITVRRSQSRRHITSQTQDTWLTFDPEDEADQFRDGFRALESLNEETPNSEMNLHAQTGNDIDIVTYVREGSLINQDWAGELRRIEAGEFQRTSASRAFRHRIINGSLLNPSHVFQSCITPEGNEFEFGSEKKRFPVADREGVLRLVASPDGREGSLSIRQNLRMFSSVLHVGHHVIHELGRDRSAWVHVVKGRILLQEHYLGTGDAAALQDERVVSFTAQVPSEILLFDLA